MMKTFSPRVVCIAVIGLAACAPATQQSAGSSSSMSVVSLPASNPFAAVSTLPFHAPDFTKIREADYAPAFDVGMKQQIAEMDAIASQSEAPTFDNTIVAMEKSGEVLTRVSKVFNALTGAHTSDGLQKIQEDVAPKLAAHSDAIFLNDKLYQRVKSIYDRRDALGLTPEQKTLVELYNRNFVRSGANLSEADKVKLRAFNQEEAKLTTDFQNRLLAATKAGALVIDNIADLEGLSADQIAAAAAAAKQRGLDGKWVIQLQNTTQHPLQTALKKRAVRERLFIASTTRTEHGDANDTRDIVKRLAQLRGDKAKLLGFPNWSAYALNNQMAKTPENATKLLTDLVPAATARARSEIATMQALIDKEGGGFKLAPWDYQYYAERVRKEQFDLDESQIKPYFETNRVLRDGAFFAAEKLYGLTFKERKDIPVYHPDVQVYEVFDASGKSVALYYADWFKRDEKSGGAWMDQFVDQNGITGTKPVIFNVGNFAKAASGPSLLTSTEVTTLFHEFGHSIHGMLSNTHYPTVSGTNTPRDFVEFPSQINEQWAFDPTVLANYAKHYSTGAPMPQQLVDKIKKAATFNQGFATTEYLAASLLDLAWHSLPAGSPQQDVDKFEADALKRFNVAMPEIPPRYRTTYFSHIWPGGYSSSYYAYLWSEVLDHDAYAWFVENGGLTRANGQRFSDMVLSKGGTMDPAEMYKAFRGRDPNVEYLIIGRGLKEAPPKK